MRESAEGRHAMALGLLLGALVLLQAGGCRTGEASPDFRSRETVCWGDSTLPVREIGETALSEPVDRSKEEWRARLTAEQYRITRLKGSKSFRLFAT